MFIWKKNERTWIPIKAMGTLMARYLRRTGVAVTALFMLNAAVAPALAAERAAERFIVVVDISGSMQGEKIAALSEAAKLMCVLLEGTIDPVPFREIARADAPLRLDTDDARIAAMTYFSGLRAGGGTNYLSALDTVIARNLPKGTASVFITDGDNQTGTPADVLERARRCPGAIYTVGIGLNSPQARQLLAEMAKVTGGSTTTVANAEELVTTLIKITIGLSDYVSYTPADKAKVFRGTLAGTVLAIGYDTELAVEGTPALMGKSLEVQAKLVPESVIVRRIGLGQSTDITIRKTRALTPAGRLAKVLRNDAQDYVFKVGAADGRVTAGATTEVVADPKPAPLDASGKPVPLHDTEVRVEVTDQSGAVRGQAVAVPQRDGSGRKVAQVPIPPEVNKPLKIVINQSFRDGSARFGKEQVVDVVTEAPRADGLTLPRTSRVNLGATRANAGRVELAKITVPTADAEAVEYRIEALDLSGPAAALPLRVNPEAIRPVTGRPAEVALSTEVANVPTGTYNGTLKIFSPVVPGTWNIDLTLVVHEPLTARTSGPVEVSPGRVGRASVTLSNASDAPLADIALEVTPIAVRGGSIEATAPPRIGLPARGERVVEVRFFVGVEVKARGRHTTELVIRRGPGAILRVPIELRIVDEGASSAILVAPPRLELTGRPGEISEFTLRLRPGATAVVPDKLRLDPGVFTDDASSRAEVPIDFRKNDLSLAGRESLAPGMVMLPERPGTYTGSIRVSSLANGSVDVPIRLIVKP